VSDGSSIVWGALRILADSSARSVLLALLVALALRVGRVHTVTARHAAWAGVLCGMLVLPLLTAVLPDVAIPLMPARAMGSNPAGMRTERGDNRPVGPFLPVANPATPEAILNVTGPVATLLSPRVPSEVPPPTGLPAWPRWLFSAYLVGVAVMLGRLALGFASCRRMIRSSEFSDQPEFAPDDLGSSALRERLRRGRVVVGTSRATRVPLTAGWLRPSILLPDGWRTWSAAKRDAALAHELAHVERRDTLLTMVAAVNLCIYWFHPLAWLLRRRLASLAERACDDLVITWTGQRTQYARHLLEFARSMAADRGRVVLGGLSMADGGDLRSRIGAILDRHRPVGRPLGRRQVAAFAVAAALVVPSLAATQIQRRVVAALPEQAEAGGPQAPEKRENGASESVVLHGRVLDPDGRPFAGALLSVPFENSRGDAFLSKGRSGPDGRFQIRLTRSEFTDCTYDPLKNIRVAASADGFGLGWDEVRSRDGEAATDAELTLRLVKDVPIEGRILTLEGKPVAGA
jgi:hypothetical protein